MTHVQIKTLELLIVKILRSKNISESKVFSAFSNLTKFFNDHDFVFKTNHSEIINTIYLTNFYLNKSANALSGTFHLDTKTLLNYRKNYLILFAKYYLGLTSPTSTILPLLHSTLKDELKSFKSASDQKPDNVLA